MKKLCKSFLVRAGLCATLLLSMSGCEKERQKAEVSPLSAEYAVSAATTLLATIQDQEKSKAVASSPVNNPSLAVVFSEQGKGVAYVLQSAGKSHIVHNGKAGRPVTGIDQIALSPDGRRIAYSAQIDGKWRMVIDDKTGMDSDEVGEPVFSPDSRHIAYEARTGDKWHIVLDDRMNAIGMSHNIRPIFSADSNKIAYVEKINDKGALRLIVSELTFKTRKIIEFSGDQLLANKERTRLAAVKQNNKRQRVIQFSFDRPDDAAEGPLYDAINNIAFGANGGALSYVGVKAGKRYLVLNDKEEALPEGELPFLPVVRPDQKGAGIIMINAGRYFLHQGFYRDNSAKKHYEEAADLVYSKDGRYAFAAREGNNWFIVVNGKEGPVFDRVVTPVFSPDGKLLIYRARKDGKRFVVVADAYGKTIRQHPSYEQVFPVVFTAEGKSVAYGVKDGNKLIWKVEKAE